MHRKMFNIAQACYEGVHPTIPVGLSLSGAVVRDKSTRLYDAPGWAVGRGRARVKPLMLSKGGPSLVSHWCFESYPKNRGSPLVQSMRAALTVARAEKHPRRHLGAARIDLGQCLGIDCPHAQ